MKWFVGWVSVGFSFWLGYWWGSKLKARKQRDHIYTTIDPASVNDQGCISFWRMLPDGTLELIHSEELPVSREGRLRATDVALLDQHARVLPHRRSVSGTVFHLGGIMSHTCHWPGCPEEVPPAMWGCKTHWFNLPQPLRDAIKREYRPGQENDKMPSVRYMLVARIVQGWIAGKVIVHADGSVSSKDPKLAPYITATGTGPGSAVDNNPCKYCKRAIARIREELGAARATPTSGAVK